LHSETFQSASGKPCILSRKTKNPLEAGLKSFGGERGSTGAIREGGASKDLTRANALVFFFFVSVCIRQALHPVTKNKNPA
jgi:hypothetical protein